MVMIGVDSYGLITLFGTMSNRIFTMRFMIRVSKAANLRQKAVLSNSCVFQAGNLLSPAALAPARVIVLNCLKYYLNRGLHVPCIELGSKMYRDSGPAFPP